MKRKDYLVLALSLAMTGCGDNSIQLLPDAGEPDAPVSVDANDETGAPTTYTFESRFVPGESSVLYDGQVFRQVLISELNAYIGGLTGQLDTQAFVPESGDVVAALDFYYAFNSSTSGEVELALSTTPALLQKTYAEISSNKDLKGKLAGNDPIGQHKEWTTDFVGWDVATTPEGLLRSFFAQLDALAVNRSRGVLPTDPSGAAITKVYVTPEGQDLQQLIQKFLIGAVSLSQGVDDYLDNDVPGNGLLAPNTRDGQRPWTVLEHQWDEAFGYFGAARDYNDYTDDEIAGAGGRAGWSGGYHDTDGDGAVDLQSEYNFGASSNAAKRDRGSAAAAPTDFSKTIFDAFLAGRHIIASAGETLTDAEMAALVAQRDIIVINWEKVIAATVVHYMNNTLRHMATFGTESYNFYNHAKHWSEMKGFALGLQFSRFSPLDAERFAQLHGYLGTAPVLATAEAEAIDQYRSDLLAARAILAGAYDFDPANVGDDSGESGW